MFVLKTMSKQVNFYTCFAVCAEGMLVLVLWNGSVRYDDSCCFAGLSEYYLIRRMSVK